MELFEPTIVPPFPYAGKEVHLHLPAVPLCSPGGGCDAKLDLLENTEEKTV